MQEFKNIHDYMVERDRISETYEVATLVAGCYIQYYVDGASCMGCKYLLYCDVINKKESRRKKERKKMGIDLTKKITITLSEDDIKEIIADYVRQQLGENSCVTKENVEFKYGTVDVGTQMYPCEKTVLKECMIKR